MAKRGSKSTKLQKAHAAGSSANAEEPKLEKKERKISDELLKAVKDLGGDEDDLDLIEGIDSDDEGTAAAPKGDKSASDEKKLKKELGDFMKGLDFGNVAVAAVESSEEEELEESEEDEEESADEDEDEEESEEEESEEEESEDEDEEEAEEAPAPAVESKKVAFEELKPAAKATIAPPADADNTSGTNVPAASSWPSLLPPLPPLTEAPPPLAPHKLNNYRQRGARMLESLPALNRAGSSSDQAFIAQILASGTHQDKLSALVLLVRESPIHAVKELDKLRGMAGWKEDGIGGGGNKDQRVAVMKALADWWVAGGGKETGKLRYFADQPLLQHPDVTDRHLLVFAFEDYLKKWFFNMLQVLEVLSHDTLPFVRTQALHIIFRLLSGNAEQEQNLLRLGVNKLGDTDRPVASKASHHILQLLQAHPAMKAVVGREVSALVLKPAGAAAGATPGGGGHMRFDDDSSSKKPAAGAKPETAGHGRYYGLITLNQMTLTRKDQEVAGKLVDLYFEVFREILGNTAEDKDEKDAGLGGEAVGEEEIAKVAGKVQKWRGRHKGTRTKNGRKSALEEEELIETGEAKLVAAVLTGINRALPFAKLDETMFTTYMDTLFKITHAGTFNTSIQALNLIFQVSKTESESREVVSDRFYRTLYDSLFDGRLISSSKQAMYLNLLFKAMKADDRTPRVMAFVKRLLQMLSMHQPPFICGALYLLGELFAATPGLKRMLIEPEDDGEEHFVDADSDKKAAEKPSTKSSFGKEYDGRKRDPTYANADTSCLWELVPFLNHFHPSVSLQANQLLVSQPLTGSSDISLNTLVAFLDRFVYRNPKKTLQPKGASIMQPAAASDQSGMVVDKRGARGEGEAGMMVNSEAFWRKKIDEVPVEMMFFHRYFAEKLKRKEKKGKKDEGSDEDDDEEDEDEKMESAEGSDDEEKSEAESDSEEASDAAEDDEDSDPEEAAIWKAMKASMPGRANDIGLSDEDIDDDDDDISISEDDDEDSSDEDEDDEDDSEDEEEDEESEEEAPAPLPKSKSKSKRTARSPSPASSQSSFPDFADEEEDIISDEDMSDIILDGKTSDAEDEDVGGKRKRNAERKEKRKKRKEMPLFGSYEDYAALIEQGGSDEE
ncbi:hypothetical protein IAT38_006663 [Cryptococcus sp. DSM 104549]